MGSSLEVLKCFQSVQSAVHKQVLFWSEQHWRSVYGPCESLKDHTSNYASLSVITKKTQLFVNYFLMETVQLHFRMYFSTHSSQIVLPIAVSISLETCLNCAIYGENQICISLPHNNKVIFTKNNADLVTL